jgi:hypothetical protein
MLHLIYYFCIIVNQIKNNKMLKKTSIILLAAITILFAACDKDDPIIPNEEELITTLNYSLTPTGGGAAIVLSYKDLDGDGGDAPIITGGTLSANQTYTGALDLLNEIESPAESITAEIEEEDEDHQFFFQSTASEVSIVYNDQDADGNPVGLSTTLTTGAAMTGFITITLRHEPSKTASGVSTGDLTNAGGETDIEVTFPIDVQ